MPADMLAMPIRDFIAATAAKSPTPGGGSVAALAGALGAALASMALEYSVGKKGLEVHRPALANALVKLKKASEVFQELVAEDMAAYEAVSCYLKQPRGQRESNPDFLAAVVAAIRVPEAVGALALNVMDICAAMLDKSNAMLASDLVMGAALANATVRGAELNVLANVRLLPNPQEAQQARREAAAMVAKADAMWAALRTALEARLQA